MALGRVGVWLGALQKVDTMMATFCSVSAGCLQVVCRVSAACLQGVRRASARWPGCRSQWVWLSIPMGLAVDPSGPEPEPGSGPGSLGLR